MRAVNVENIKRVLERFEQILEYEVTSKIFQDNLLLSSDLHEVFDNVFNENMSEEERQTLLLKTAESTLELAKQRIFFSQLVECIQRRIDGFLCADIDYDLFYYQSEYEDELPLSTICDSLISERFTVDNTTSEYCEICDQRNTEYHFLPATSQNTRISFGGIFFKKRNQLGRDTLVELNLIPVCICPTCYDFLRLMPERNNLSHNIKPDPRFELSDDLPF